MKKDRFGIPLDANGTQFWRRPPVTRRVLFQHAASAVGGYFFLPELDWQRRAQAQETPARAKNVIFIMMRGGPSQTDTLDLKQGAWTPSNLDVQTYNGLKFPRALMPKLAGQLDDIVLVRSVRAWAAVHGLAQVWMQIGRNPAAGSSRIAPHIGSVVSHELASQTKDAVLPSFITLNTLSGIGNGFLPAEAAPFFAAPGGGGLTNSRHNDGQARFDRRYSLLLEMDAPLRATPELGSAAFQTQSYNNSARKMIYNDKIDTIFTFDTAERTRYGNTNFGNSCIAARNMLRARAGARFIQIMQPDWDQHDNIWTPLPSTLSHYYRGAEFDNGLGALLTDLKNEGLLDSTLVVAMGEFGRTVGNLNGTRGRDHLLQQAALVAGAGIRGGRSIGESNSAGTGTLTPGWSGERDIRAEDIEATMYFALGIDWNKSVEDPTGRRFEYVPRDKFDYKPITELWG